MDYSLQAYVHKIKFHPICHLELTLRVSLEPERLIRNTPCSLFSAQPWNKRVGSKVVFGRVCNAGKNIATIFERIFIFFPCCFVNPLQRLAGELRPVLVIHRGSLDTCNLSRENLGYFTLLTRIQTNKSLFIHSKFLSTKIKTKQCISFNGRTPNVLEY